MSQTTIREYNNQDSSRIKQFYITAENQKKNKRVFDTFKNQKSVRQSWQIGIVGLCVLHLFKRTTWRMGLLEAFIWTTGLAIFWYKSISQDYNQRLNGKVERMMEALGNLEKEEKSNAWIMENKEGKLVGAAILVYQDNREGKLGYLPGTSAENTHQMVRIVMAFAKSNKIEVISKRSDSDI
ncbi:hypothetical protein BY458DRAFT_502259 [Sporodiniella umbellata]|nr:hypothetical protein BY458DRAFT_502259 [Sporodiniella umbellata]